MENRKQTLPGWAFALCLGLPCSALATAPGQKTREYVVQKGDTCMGIARRELGDAQLYEQIHMHNEGMGPSPHRLRPGRTLMLPILERDPDAVVTATAREVRARMTGSAGWQSAARGTKLFRGWHVNTLEQSWAELTFADASKVQMRENTLVIIYGNSGVRLKQNQRETQLEHGTLRSRLGELAGGEAKPQMKVVTPSAVASLEGGDTLIKVDDAGSSRFANHGDGTTTLRSRAGGRKVQLKKGLGSKVVRGKQPTKPKPLPKAPTWLAGDDTFVGAPSGSISGQWQAKPEASFYRVEVRSVGLESKVIASVRVERAANRYEIHGLPPGDYEVRVATIDSDRMESLLSAPRKQRVYGVMLEGPAAGAAPPMPEVGGEVLRRKVLPGAMLQAPQGLECRIGSGEWGAKSSAIQPGVHAIECRDKEGVVAKGMELEVVPVMLDRDATTVGALVEPPMKVEREVLSRRRVRLTASIDLPEQLVARSTPGVKVSSIEKIGPSEWEMAFTALATAGQGERIDLALVEGEKAPTVASVFLAVQNLPPAPEEPPPTVVESHPRFEFGGQVGVGFFAGDNSLHGYSVRAGVVQDSPSHALPAAGVDLTVRAGYYPLHWLGVELENRLISTRVNGRDSAANLFGGSLSLVGRLPFRASPYVGIGAAIMSLDSSSDADRGLGKDTDVGPVFDAGFVFYIKESLGLRIGFRDTLLVDRGKILHVLSAGAGALVRVGKRRKVMAPKRKAGT